jgi:protoheme IX farnesyltransferase
LVQFALNTVDRVRNVQLVSQVSPVSAEVQDYIALLKPRVMSLVVFTGFAGVVVAPGHLHPLLAVVAVVCIAIGAGAAGAINMWYDRDIDAIMTRTCNRPIPAGRMVPGNALGFGILLSVASVVIMGLSVNLASALLLSMAILYYVFIYTVWLKRRTPQNIVIGGAAGAFPPMIGWAAVSGGVGVESVALFALIFFWTPPHFWALSLYRTGDYALAGIPMLPVVAGRRETKRQMLIYTVLLLPLGTVPYWLGIAGSIYLTTSVVLGSLFVAAALAVWFDDGDRAAKRMFGFSIFHLFALFAALILDRAPGLGG